MQCLTHVMKLVVILSTLLYVSSPLAASLVVDENYCNGVALIAHATAEARQRKTPILQWEENLRSLKGYGVKNKDNVLYNVLPAAIKEVHVVYSRKQNPRDAYVTSFKTCMDNNYGKAVVVK